MTEGLLLTKEDRDRFAAYLERDAESANAIADLMAKSSLPKIVAEAASKRYREEAAAATLIARKLRATEDV